MTHDDFEHLVEQSLDRRAGDLGTPTGDLSDVLRHVDRRQRRRRSVAVAGSLVIVAVGAIGFASLDREPVPAMLAGPTGTGTLVQQSVWRCVEPLPYTDEEVGGSEAGGEYFATCGTVLLDESGNFPPRTGTLLEGSLVEVPASTIPGGVTPTTAFDPTSNDPMLAGEPMCTSDTGTAPECALTNDEQTVTVMEDETLAVIALRYRLSPITIALYNGWPELTDRALPTGDIVRVPPIWYIHDSSTTTTMWLEGNARSPVEQMYTIRAGDSLGEISDRFEVTLEQLINYNQFEDGVNHLILPGDIIAIPPGARIAGTPSSATVTTPTVPPTTAPAP